MTSAATGNDSPPNNDGTWHHRGFTRGVVDMFQLALTAQTEPSTRIAQFTSLRAILRPEQPSPAA